MGVAAILVMWSTSFEQILSPDHEIWLITPAAWEQMFESINPSDLWQKSNNDLDLWYSYTHLDKYMYLYQLSV